jgi:plasmid stability protein
MPVNLSIKNVPDELADRLRQRADAAHRSMQGELMAILEAALGEIPPLRPGEILARLGALDLCTEREAAADVRHDRDAMHG